MDDLACQSRYLEIGNRYPSYMRLFTYALKDGDRVASAACCRGYTSGYTAEFHASLIGLEIMSNSNKISCFLRLFVLHAGIA